MRLLRQSTSQVINFGPFLDSTDGNTEETALTITQADMLLSKDGGVLLQKNASGNATHDARGNYSTTLNTTDTNTVGILRFYCHPTGACSVFPDYYVVPGATYDALTTDGLNNLAQTDIVSSGAITTAAGEVTVGTNNDKDDYNISGTIDTLDGLNNFDPTSDAVANVTLVATTTTNTDMRGTDSAFLAASYTAPDNAGITSNGNAIAALNDLSSSQVNAEMLDVLTVDTFAELGSVPAATSSIIDKINWSFSLSRNKLLQTATTTTLRNDADAGDIATATVSDDAITFTRGEFT